MRHCECGCGNEVKGINYHTHTPIRFILGHCNTGHFKKGKRRRGEGNPNWKGGRRFNTQGYILIWKPEHADADIHGYILEHRWMIEQAIGRPLSTNEYVHHRNHKRDDNRLENLWLMTSPEHTRHHSMQRPIMERKYWGKNQHLRK